MKSRILFTTTLAACLLAGAVHAPARAEGPVYVIKAENGAFTPANLDVPANAKIEIVVKNADSAQVEFESYKLNREQKIAPDGQTAIFIGPLEPGVYAYFDDNNPDAKGTITAK